MDVTYTAVYGAVHSSVFRMVHAAVANTPAEAVTVTVNAVVARNIPAQACEDAVAGEIGVSQ